MAALQALPPPTTANYQVELLGYYNPGDNKPQIYLWNSTSTATPDNGAIVAASSSPSTGRWLLEWDGVTANVRCWGAIPVALSTVSSPAVPPYTDRLPNINNAINALQIGGGDNSESPGAGGTGHVRNGTLYFPGTDAPQGNRLVYPVSGEIFISAYMRVLGDGSQFSGIYMFPNVATNPSSPKFIIHYLYNQGANAHSNPNENFYTGVQGINVGADPSNLGCSGVKYVCSNDGFIIDVISNVPLEPFFIDAKGVYFNNLTAGYNCTGPGLEIQGTEISGGYADIEHVNESNALGANGLLVPAVYICMTS